MSEAYWTSNMGADMRVVGQSLTLNSRPFEILGVMPAGFAFPQEDIDVWVPGTLRNVEQEHRGFRAWNAIGRLAPGATPEVAEAELSGVLASLAERFAESEGWRTSVRPAGAALRDAGNLPLLLFGAVAVVLLIACVNTANILFVRSLERTRDAAVRAALGASRGRLARLVLLETAVLAGAAGVLGIAGSLGIVSVLDRVDPGVLPAWESLSVDWSVAFVSMGVAVFVALLAGAVPALHVARPGLAGTLAEFGRQSSGGRLDRLVRNGLVTAEVALTMVLLHAAGLLVWSLYSVSNVDPGFEQNGVLTATAVLRGSGGEQITQYEQIMEKLNAIPGVLAARLPCPPPAPRGWR